MVRYLLFFIVFCLFSCPAFAAPGAVPEVPLLSKGPSVLQQALEKAGEKDGIVSSGPVTLSGFRSVLVVVNMDGEPVAKPEEWLADELKVLKVSAAPEEMAWELFRLAGSEGVSSSGDAELLEAYQKYLRSSYDTALQADITSSGDEYHVYFTLVDFRDPVMPVLYSKQLESSGERSVVLHALFKALASDLLYAREGSLVAH